MDQVEAFAAECRERDEAYRRAAPVIDRLTDAERRTLLTNMYAEMRTHGGDPDRMAALARNVVATVHLRVNVPGYREIAARPPARPGRGVPLEDVLRKLEER